MVGRQQGITLINHESVNKDRVFNIYDNILIQLYDAISLYYVKEIKIIQLLYVEQPKLNKEFLLKNIDELYISNINKNIKFLRQQFYSNLLPITLNEKFYGEKLINVNYRHGYVCLISIHDINLLELIEEKCKLNNITYEKIPSASRLYLRSVRNQYLITVVILTQDPNVSIKNVYSLHGTLLSKNVIDTNLGNNKFSRKINDFTLFVNNGEIEKNCLIKTGLFNSNYQKTYNTILSHDLQLVVISFFDKIKVKFSLCNLTTKVLSYILKKIKKYILKLTLKYL